LGYGWHGAGLEQVITGQTCRWPLASKLGAVKSPSHTIQFLSNCRVCVITVECQVVADEDAVSDGEASRIDLSFASQMTSH